MLLIQLFWFCIGYQFGYHVDIWSSAELNRYFELSILLEKTVLCVSMDQWFPEVLTKTLIGKRVSPGEGSDLSIWWNAFVKKQPHNLSRVSDKKTYLETVNKRVSTAQSEIVADHILFSFREK